MHAPPPFLHVWAEQLLDSPTSGRVHLWPHVATETGVRAPVRVPASACVCVCVPAHITHTPAGPRAQRTNDSNRVELIAEHSRTKPNRAERRRVGAGAKAGSSGWPNQSAVGRIANLLLAVLRCAQRE